jgi:hypothetical protein
LSLASQQLVLFSLKSVVVDKEILDLVQPLRRTVPRNTQGFGEHARETLRWTRNAAAGSLHRLPSLPGNYLRPMRVSTTPES